MSEERKTEFGKKIAKEFKNISYEREFLLDPVSEDKDYDLKRVWNTFCFEFKKITDNMIEETEKLFLKISKELLK